MNTEGKKGNQIPTKILKGNERFDDLQRSGLRIIQDPKGNRFSTDAVLLSSFCKARGSDNVVDLGTGTGILPLLIWAKWGPKHIVGIELDEATADMAARSIMANDLGKSIEIIHADLKRSPEILGRGKFNLVVANPPYIRLGGGERGISGPRALARHEIGCTFDDVAEAAAALLVPSGRFALVHRPDRLADVFYSLKNHGLEPKLLRTVHTKPEDAPTMVLVTSVKGAAPGLKVGPPLVLYKDDGTYTEETEAIYFGA